MKRALLKFFCIYLTFILLFILERGVFACLYGGASSPEPMAVGEWWLSLWHGLPLDASVAGYLTIVPGLLIAAALMPGGSAGASGSYSKGSRKSGSKWLRITEDVYLWVVAAMLSVVFCLDLVLYRYWHFRLDATPVFYFMSSPSAALASVTGGEMAAGIAGAVGLTAAFFAALRYGAGNIRIVPSKSRSRLWQPVAMVVVTAALFIPIRGGFTVATMNVSRAYFSQKKILNHTALNPGFNLLHSLLHQGKDPGFAFMPEGEAEGLFRRMHSVIGRQEPEKLLSASASTPDIYVVLLESFSAALMPSLGGEPIATGLDSVARQGLLFTNFYASGIRTDRAIPAVVSAFPAQPTMSVMKYVEKAAQLPSLPKALKPLGYESEYYYGGDAHFTNMQAYLVNAGFASVVSDKDFPLSARMSKWGAPDHLVFDKALQEARRRRDARRIGQKTAPTFTVIQTSSSHEPFRVPGEPDPRFKDRERLNAFAYADRSLCDFLNQLHAEHLDDDALIVMLADHYGVYPETPPAGVKRHHVPMVMTGGALGRRGVWSVPGAQTDLAATLLQALGRGSDDFKFSKNLLHPGVRHFAAVAGHEEFGIVTAADTVMFECHPGGEAKPEGDEHPKAAPNPLEREARAYLQILYRELSRL